LIYMNMFRNQLRPVSSLPLVISLMLLATATGLEGREVKWFTAWAASHGQRLTTPALSGSSVRMIIRPTISGDSVRLKLENTLGQAPVEFSAVYLGQQAQGASVVPGTNRQLTFDGHPGLSLAPGGGAYSDPIKMKVRAFTTYAVGIDVVSASDISSHFLGLVSNYMVAGRHAADPGASGYVQVPDNNTGPNGATWPLYWVAALDVTSPVAKGTIVLFGDSITEGRCSTRTEHGSSAGVVQKDLYQRWSDILAKRLSALPSTESKAIANEGISGNRIIRGGTGPTALSRMDRDVLDRKGTTHVVFFIATNDIAGGELAPAVIQGSKQVIDRLRAAGLKIIGVTIVPRGGAATWTTSMEQQRLAVNDWIRHEAKFDGIIDFDQLMQGPLVPSNNAVQMRPEYSCFDGVHPNDTGYSAMGAFIDLKLFR
jgi:lysophospholipase L1-like esterase